MDLAVILLARHKLRINIKSEALMKTSNLLLFALLVGIAQGCSKKEESSSETVGNTQAIVNPLLPGVPNGTGTSVADSTSGTVPFTPVSRQMMENYIASHPLNNPTNYRISMNLKNAGENHYAGEIRLSYEDNGRTYTGIFNAPEGKNESYPSRGENLDVGKYKSQYNYWFRLGNQTVFQGQFQDSYGAVVLIIDSAVNLGDAQGLGQVSGSLWFKNFAYSFAPQSTTRNCWFIYMGPYDCRSTTVITKSQLEPSDGYRKLGTFSGVVAAQVFQ